MTNLGTTCKSRRATWLCVFACLLGVGCGWSGEDVVSFEGKVLRPAPQTFDPVSEPMTVCCPPESAFPLEVGTITITPGEDFARITFLHMDEPLSLTADMSWLGKPEAPVSLGY